MFCMCSIKGVIQKSWRGEYIQVIQVRVVYTILYFISPPNIEQLQWVQYRKSQIKLLVKNEESIDWDIVGVFGILNWKRSHCCF